LSDLIPVSTCETDTDLDTVNDNIDLEMTKTVLQIVQNLMEIKFDISKSSGTVAVGLYSIHFLEQLPRQQLLVQRHL
jgi:hypothetical protein